MRNSIIGLIVGAVLGIVMGATVIAPRLDRSQAGDTPAPVQTPGEIAMQLPRALAPQPAVALKMASAFPAEAPIAGDLAQQIDFRVWEISRGQMEIRFYPPGALAPVSDLYEAVGAGTIDSAIAPADIGASAAPALQLFGGAPFGPAADELLGWLQADGQELFDEINNARGVHGLPCGLLPAPGFGWFRREILAPQDLSGLRMSVRAGLGAQVLERVGAVVEDIAPADVVLALEQGRLDGIVAAPQTVDAQLRLQTWLKVYYPQGWQQSPTLLVLLINLRKWSQLSTVQRSQMEVVCSDNIRRSLAVGGSAQYASLKRMVGGGVRLERLPPAVRDALERSWQQTVQIVTDADPEFRRVWRSLSTFRADYAVWHELVRP